LTNAYKLWLNAATAVANQSKTVVFTFRLLLRNLLSGSD
jgi:hypothetical protein